MTCLGFGAHHHHSLDFRLVALAPFFERIHFFPTIACAKEHVACWSNEILSSTRTYLIHFCIYVCVFGVAVQTNECNANLVQHMPNHITRASRVHVLMPNNITRTPLANVLLFNKAKWCQGPCSYKHVLVVMFRLAEWREKARETQRWKRRMKCHRRGIILLQESSGATRQWRCMDSSSQRPSRSIFCGVRLARIILMNELLSQYVYCQF